MISLTFLWKNGTNIANGKFKFVCERIENRIFLGGYKGDWKNLSCRTNGF